MASPPAAQTAAKRKAAMAGLPSSGRTVKRRASRACHCCRARKVRCDVVESGTPCTNCRLDEVECVVSDSKRRRRPAVEGEHSKCSPGSSHDSLEEVHGFAAYEDVGGSAIPSTLDEFLATAPSATLDFDMGHHVPHMLYQTQGHRLTKEERVRRMSTLSQSSGLFNSPSMQMAPNRRVSPQRQHRADDIMPAFVRPLPPRIMPEDAEFLERKGALTIPEVGLRNELLRTYMQYVHPYMPLLDLRDFLQPIERNDGSAQISLLLFHAVMFAATAYIDMRFLQAQGYETRKAARKVFFQRARLLYDFDYEMDRISLVQALLLMTYWYETPDDQKDTWHWMGVSLSLAHTIGLHRNPEKSNMDIKKQRLWKRIWWSCFMRDRLIALGMRRPTRIKNEDCDVPMLTLDDFDTEPLPAELVRMLGGLPVVRDSAKRLKLARMCIEKAKLCLCISHVLVAQYSVLSHKFGGTTETTMMLVPKKSAGESFEVMQCDRELDLWYQNLDEDLRYRKLESKERANEHDGEVLTVHRALLSMIYLTTSSALHRPQVLPAMPSPAVAASVQELSRRRVREAAIEITDVAQDLYDQDLVRFLPTTGVTVLLPAVIIHLLDIKSSDAVVRGTSLRRFYQCMQVLQRLREMYASADFAFSFLEAAIRKANIDMPPEHGPAKHYTTSTHIHQRPRPAADDLTNHHITLTPPPELYTSSSSGLHDIRIPAGEPGPFSALTPPMSDGSIYTNIAGTSSNTEMDLNQLDGDMELSKNDFDALINFDAGADLFAAEDGLGVDLDMDWMAGMPQGEGTAAEDTEAGRPVAVTGDIERDLGIQLDV